MHPYLILDVFTDTPLQGNALAVFTEGEHVPSRLMQAASRELNLSETVFLLPGEDGADARARIFTTVAELPFAGHPVLGSAFVVGAARELEVVRLSTGAGVIQVRLERDADGEIVFGEMDQPLPAVAPFDRPDELLEALGLGEADVRLPIEAYRNGPEHVLVAVGEAGVVAGLAPDLQALRSLGDFGFSCFARTGPAGVKTRMFGPAIGVAEDPATGSAAGPIAAHLLRHGLIASGTTVELRQGEEIGRPSVLFATAFGTAERIARVSVGGRAVRVAEGRFRLS